ncbi:MAG: hypothetical protein P4M14_03140 [Gammaproteobacteria bacterium]|nr:hypothetical protein [Gammaproteobacteria bacterium]
MRSSREIFDDIKRSLILIRQHGGALGQYDSGLFNLFIEAYRNHHMDFHSNPRLTGQAIIDRLVEDEEYSNIEGKIKYNLDEQFYEKWTYWTEAFDKGLSGNFIIWRPDS